MIQTNFQLDSISPLEQEELKSCALKLELLSGSRDSIMQTSSFFIKLGDKNQTLIQILVKLWVTKLNESPDKKRLALIYLANEIINKSKAMEVKKTEKSEKKESQDTNETTYWKVFEGFIEDAVIQSGNVLKHHTKDRIDILKVVKIWKDRNIFDPLIVDRMISKLQELENDYLKQQ